MALAASVTVLPLASRSTAVSGCGLSARSVLSGSVLSTLAIVRRQEGGMSMMIDEFPQNSGYPREDIP
jgi:hypothetical protein